MDGGTWERATWVTKQTLREVLEADLNTSAVRDWSDRTPEELTRLVLSRQGTFAALLEEDRTFASLVDRQALLEGLAVGYRRSVAE